MVRAVVTSPDRVVCVVGPAGAGKTTATHALAEAFRRDRRCRCWARPRPGSRPSGSRTKPAFPRQTLHRLLADAKHSESLPDGCVLIVDEAAMAETRVLAPTPRAGRAGGRQGDPDRRPTAATRRRRGRTLRRHRRTTRRDRADREPPTTRRAGAARAPSGPRRPWPRLPRLRRATRPPRRLRTTRSRAGRACSPTGGGTPAPTCAGNVMLAHRRTDVAELNTLARALMASAKAGSATSASRPPDTSSRR